MYSNLLIIIKIENSDNILELISIILSAIFSILTLVFAFSNTNRQIKKSRQNTFDNNKYLELLKNIRNCVIYLNKGRVAAWDIQEQVREAIRIISSSKNKIINFGQLLDFFIGDYNRMTYSINNMHAYYSIMDINKDDEKYISSIVHQLTKTAIKFHSTVFSLGQLLYPNKSNVENKNGKSVIKANVDTVQTMIKNLKCIRNISKQFVSGYDNLIKRFALINKNSEYHTRNSK